jgi:hypothetical protein
MTWPSTPTTSRAPRPTASTTAAISSPYLFPDPAPPKHQRPPQRQRHRQGHCFQPQERHFDFPAREPPDAILRLPLNSLLTILLIHNFLLRVIIYNNQNEFQPGYVTEVSPHRSLHGSSHRYALSRHRGSHGVNQYLGFFSCLIRADYNLVVALFSYFVWQNSKETSALRLVRIS